ncbi:Transposase [Corynebacterium faecale]|nr:Transposase [Corynebacterium faecale]
MPIKTYSEEFNRDAVALYENSPGTSIQTIATDLGVNRATLANWVKKYRTTTPTETPSPASVTEAERIRQLEREVSRLREERDIVAEGRQIFSRQETRL